MPLRARKSIESLPGITMIVRTMSGVGSAFEQFKPHSLDEHGAMLVLKGKVEMDAPLRVIINAPEPLAQKFVERQKKSLADLKQNEDGSFQLFGNWLKVQWTLSLDDVHLEMMGCNYLIWTIHEQWNSQSAQRFHDQAEHLLKLGYTANVDVVMLLKHIVSKYDMDFLLTPAGLEKLARSETHLNAKILYCLLGGYQYSDLLHSIFDFKTRYIRDPFQKKYGILHGTMALNQGDENWEETFEILRQLIDDMNQPAVS